MTFAFDHPTENLLRQFLAGKLNSAELTRIAVHLIACRQCAGVVEQLVETTATGADASTLPPPPDRPADRGSVPVDQTSSPDADRTPHHSVTEEMKSFASNSTGENPSTLPHADATDQTATFDAGSTHRTASAKRARRSSQYSGSSRYMVLRPHAKGGLGEVFIAQDQELNREVALKEIQSRFSDVDDLRARFRLEAEITGNLEHPGIVPVYGLGQYPDGRPYYAMRFIRGDTLKKGIDDFHASFPAGKTSLTDGEGMLELHKLLTRFIDVCNAIEYAHKRGVLHRDLKPGNVVLGKFGETLVVDWGLAKAIGTGEDLDASMLPVRPSKDSGMTPTIMGSAIGTPAYMSPEQAAGETDQLGPETDIYSLGATLYQLLTGRTPFHGLKLDEVMARVKTGTYPAPRSVRSDVPRALEAICLKAMALQPTARYHNAAQLAEDIERFVAREPVSCYREPILVRMRRFIRRHQLAFTGVAAAGIVLLASLAAGLQLVTRHNMELADANQKLEVSNQKERDARGDAEQSKSLALQRLREAREAVDLWLTVFSHTFESLPGLDEQREVVLAQAVADYEKFAAQVSDEPELELERGRTWYRLGDVQRQLGKPDKALAAYQQAQTVLRGRAATLPTTEPALELANCQTREALALMELGRLPEADTAYTQAVEGLRALVAAGAAEERVREALATALSNHAVLRFKRNDSVGAQAAIEEAIRQLTDLHRQTPDHTRFGLALAKARGIKAELAWSEDDLAAAEKLLIESLQLLTELVTDRPEDSEALEARASTRLLLGAVLRDAGRNEDERQQYEEALVDYESLLRNKPGIPAYRERLASLQLNLANLANYGGDLNAAESALIPAITTFDELSQSYRLPEYYEQLAASRALLGEVYRGLNRLQESEQALQSAVRLYASLIHELPDVPEYLHGQAIARGQLGQTLWHSGKLEESNDCLRAAADDISQVIQSSDQERSVYLLSAAHIYWYQAEVLTASDQSSAADEASKKALTCWQELHRSSSTPEVAHAYAWFLCLSQSETVRRNNSAVEFASLACRQAPENEKYKVTLGIAYYRAGDWRHAVQLLSDSEVIEANRGAALFFLSMGLWQLGEKDAARTRWEEAEAWRVANRPGDWQLTRARDEASALMK